MVGKIIAFINQKGGVGKTATSANLAYCLATNGKKILLIDVDPSRNLTKIYCKSYEHSVKDVFYDKKFNPQDAIFQAKVRENLVPNLYILPSHVSLAAIAGHIASLNAHKEKLLARQIDKIQNQYDYIIIDCPPMLTDFSVNAVYAADFILIPLTYEKDALEGVGDLFKFINEIKEDQEFDYMMLRNGLDSRKKTANAYIEKELEPFIAKNKVFKTIIPQDEEINKAKFDDEPVLTFCSKSCGAQEYYALAKEIQEFLDGK